MSVNSVGRSLGYNVLDGARHGAVVGATIGMGIVGSVVGLGLVFYGLEAGNRHLGFEPKWPVFKGDCQLDQFRSLSFCTTPPIPFPTFTIIAGTTMCGIVAGAISGVAKTVFSDISKAEF